jgi:uncharacterized protein (TIGR02246 family)
VDQFLEAWRNKDSKKIASLFAAHGQLWDVHGELWISPAQVERGLVAHFGVCEPDELVPDVKDVKFVSGEVSVATLVWRRQGEPIKGNPSALRMVLVLYEARPGWLVASAHLAQLPLEGS